MLTSEQQQFLTGAAEGSVTSERATGLPAEVTLAQAIFESGWGKACPGNNCFGIKVDQHGSGVQYVLTSEYLNGTWIKEPLAFEKYDSLGDCFTDHARLITEGHPYAAVWQQYQADHNMDTFILALGRVYGTDPMYGAKILNMACSSIVTVAVQGARDKAVAQVKA